jgi:Metallopeptidase toxin 4
LNSLRPLLLILAWLLALLPAGALASIPRHTFTAPDPFAVSVPGATPVAADEPVALLTLHLDGLYEGGVLVRQNPWSSFDPDGAQARRLMREMYEEDAKQGDIGAAEDAAKLQKGNAQFNKDVENLQTVSDTVAGFLPPVAVCEVISGQSASGKPLGKFERFLSFLGIIPAGKVAKIAKGAVGGKVAVEATIDAASGLEHYFGRYFDPSKIQALEKGLGKSGIALDANADRLLSARGMAACFEVESTGSAIMRIKAGATFREVFHELAHADTFRRLLRDNGGDATRAAEEYLKLGRAKREIEVFENWMKRPANWDRLSEAEQAIERANYEKYLLELK